MQQINIRKQPKKLLKTNRQYFHIFLPSLNYDKTFNAHFLSEGNLTMVQIRENTF